VADDLLARAQDYLLPPLRGVIAAKRRRTPLRICIRTPRANGFEFRGRRM